MNGQPMLNGQPMMNCAPMGDDPKKGNGVIKALIIGMIVLALI